MKTKIPRKEWQWRALCFPRNLTGESIADSLQIPGPFHIFSNIKLCPMKWTRTYFLFTFHHDSVSQLLQIPRSLGWSQVHEERILGKPTSITEKGVNSNSSPNYFSDYFPFFFYIVLHCFNSLFFRLFFLFGTVFLALTLKTWTQ